MRQNRIKILEQELATLRLQFQNKIDFLQEEITKLKLEKSITRNELTPSEIREYDHYHDDRYHDNEDIDCSRAAEFLKKSSKFTGSAGKLFHKKSQILYDKYCGLKGSQF